MLIIDGKRYDAEFNEMPWTGAGLPDNAFTSASQHGNQAHAITPDEERNLEAIFASDNGGKNA